MVLSGIGSQIRDLLTAEDVARHYGFEPNRAGFIQCPFHSGDNHGSLKLYPEQRGFHCFGCGAHGSVIDFVMLLFGISFSQAVTRINADFGLGLTAQRPSPEQRSKVLEERRRAQEKKAREEAEYKSKLKEYWRLAEIRDRLAPNVQDGSIDPQYANAVKRLPILENWLDEHLGGR